LHRALSVSHLIENVGGIVTRYQISSSAASNSNLDINVWASCLRGRRASGGSSHLASSGDVQASSANSGMIVDKIKRASSIAQSSRVA